ncbi:SPRY domain-containing protein 7 [Acanthosepion pharaonis]|uniref:SPRY domain-containing protein 7 n=1 Tax=Acanthosepion pharaonis TaxID=158019 RepID=A0A812BGI5_ACAPH|nr:SPRY domain-containing protein 7 [Sepia pharaonis]
MTLVGLHRLAMDSMAACFCCLRCCALGSGFSSGHVPLKDQPAVKLDTTHMGNDVVIVKNGRRICGSGGALANAPIVQNKAYFEIKVQCGGSWGVGLALRKVDLNSLPLGKEADSWVLRRDGKLYHNGDVKIQIPELAQEGDIIGLAYDHVDLNFFLNGKPTNTPVSGLKGTLYPVMYVDEGAVLDVQFGTFYHHPPDGFDKIMIEQSLL